MYVLGISAYYHDSAAALLKDGVVIAACQEERFSRIKHDTSFPVHSVNACLTIAGIRMKDIDHVVYYEKPFWKFERILDTITHAVPNSFLHFAKAIPLWVKNRIWISSEIKRKTKFKGNILFAAHHASHAAAAFYTSPFEDAAILTIDGVGVYATTTIGTGKQGTINILKEQHFPHSLGLLYSAFTQYCGFKVNSGEYKLMGLAPYGKPVYKQLIYDYLVQTFEDGSYELNMKYFNYTEGFRMINRHFIALMGKPVRKPESPMETHYMDVAASIQEVLEEVVIKLCRYASNLTRNSSLVFSGGVALNCKLNQKIVESGIFANHYFYPCPGDAGSAVGAAYLGWYDHLGNQRNLIPVQGTYLGTEHHLLACKNVLDKYNIPYSSLSGNTTPIAEALFASRIVGWYSGRMEFGPRALGNRS